MDSLGGLVERNLGKRKEQVPRVEKIVQEESGTFVNWFHSLQVGPTIQELRESVEAIRMSEVEKNINRFKAEDRELVDLVTKRIVNKILHHPITTLKHHSENGRPKGEIAERISVLREIFGMRDQDRPDDE
jgi:glutamyl-tRNA reductase